MQTDNPPLPLKSNRLKLLARTIKLSRRLALGILVFLLGWFSYLYVYGNFHQVSSDVYRSAQLYSFNMPYYIEKYKIKSILNFRGQSDTSWYANEISISKKYNLTHYDYGISDRKIASIQQMDYIINIIKNAPKPILIHCKAGADRTSLASALYIYGLMHDYKKANQQISIIYGHFPWLGSKTIAMDKSFENFIHAKTKHFEYDN